MRVNAKSMKYFLLAAAMLVIIFYSIRAVNNVYKYESTKIPQAKFNSYIRQQEHGKVPCKPVNHVFYLKTFKTASSTITAVLHRYVLEHGLKMVIAPTIPFPNVLSEEHILSYGDVHNLGPYDILADHLRYDKKSLNEILHHDTIYVTSLRDPLDQIKSHFNEFHIAKTLGVQSSDPVRTYIENFNNFSKIKQSSKFAAGLPAINTFQLGLSMKDRANASAIMETIKMADKDFGLVMITEYLKESLLLLKRTLCWDIKDVIYLSLRKKHYKSKLQFYGPKIRRKFETISSADYRLYYHFLDKLWKNLSLQSQDFWEELKIFRKLLEQVDNFCQDVTMKMSKNASIIFDLAGDLETGEGRMFIDLDPSPFGMPFQVDAVQCAIMTLNTSPSKRILSVIQFPQLCPVRRHDKKRNIPEKYYKKLYGDELYCTEWSKFYKVPLKVLAQNKVYMWSLNGVQSPDEPH